MFSVGYVWYHGRWWTGRPQAPRITMIQRIPPVAYKSLKIIGLRQPMSLGHRYSLILVGCFLN